MRMSIAVAMGVWLAALALAAANAHSLKDLERLMGDKEKYFQSIDKDAPNFSLQDADGRGASLTDFRGKVVVLHFIYAACPDVCPLHADRIGEIQTLVSQSPMKDQVQFVSITTDPKNDTADVLRNYGSPHGLEGTNWVFLTTTPDQPEDATRKLAEQFGHKFIKMEDGYQIHGIVTHVIDKEGRWRANFHGLKFEPVNLVAFVNALVNDIAKPHEEPSQSLWQKLKSWF
jgi:protein SCO1/2